MKKDMYEVNVQLLYALSVMLACSPADFVKGRQTDGVQKVVCWTCGSHGYGCILWWRQSNMLDLPEAQLQQGNNYLNQEEQTYFYFVSGLNSVQFADEERSGRMNILEHKIHSTVPRSLQFY